ncbi:hypothetical protein OQA88_17 [Cercophora sp. LCS_1]
MPTLLLSLTSFTSFIDPNHPHHAPTHRPIHEKTRQIHCDWLWTAQAVSPYKLMVLFHVCDEFTDVEGEDRRRHIADIVMDALRNPNKPHSAGEFGIAELARQ